MKLILITLVAVVVGMMALAVVGCKSDAESAFDVGMDLINEEVRSLQGMEEAVETFERAIELDPTYARAYVGRARAHWFLDEYNLAKGDFDKAIELDPNDPTAYHWRGAYYRIELDEFNKAILDFDKSIQLEPDNPEFWYERGRTYHSLEQSARALLDFDEAIDLSGHYSESTTPLVWYYTYRAWTLSELGFYEREIKDWSTIIDNLPDDDTAYFFRGIAHKTIGEHDKADDDFAKACKLDSGNCDSPHYKSSKQK